MSRRAAFAAWLIAGAVALAPTVAAGAQGWLWPVGGDVLLGYGAAWSDSSGRPATHGGMDIGAAAGSPVRAPAAGTVRFAGPVPGGAGGRVVAVTVSTPDGLDYTCMPLEDAAVAAGQAIDAGAPLGSAAAVGDASSEGAHVHLSVRRGQTHLDPAAVLGLRLEAGPSEPSGGSVVAPAPPAPRAPVSGPTPSPRAHVAAPPPPVAPGVGATAASWDPRLASALARAHAAAGVPIPVQPLRQCVPQMPPAALPWTRPASVLPSAFAALALAALFAAPAWRRQAGPDVCVRLADKASELRVRV